MATQTRGFQTSAMPVYSPVDPSLVAFNPGRIAQGASQGMQLVSQLDQIKAFQQAQADAAALRDLKLAAENARNASTVQTAPVLANLQVAQAGAQQQLLPGQTAVGLGGIEQQLHDQAIAKDVTRPFTDSLANINAQLGEGLAQGSLNRLGQTNQLADKQLASQISDVNFKEAVRPAEQTAKYVTAMGQAERASGEAMLAQAKLKDALANMPEDNDLSRQQKIATTQKLKADAEEALGRAEYYRNGGTRKNADPVLELSRVQAMVTAGLGKRAQLLNAPVANPDPSGPAKIPLALYQATLYKVPPSSSNPKGVLNTTGFSILGIGNEKNMQPNPEAESMLQELAAIDDTNDQYRKLGENVLGEINSAKPVAKAATPTAEPVSSKGIYGGAKKGKTGNPVLTPEQVRELKKNPANKGLPYEGTDGFSRVIQ